MHGDVLWGPEETIDAKKNPASRRFELVGGDLATCDKISSAVDGGGLDVGIDGDPSPLEASGDP
ncbi:hypothetical protein KU43P_12710 [Pseudomonas sp. KU43P]|nr:hypothetical protein KU43P_12710 [Pseudomonas sp. KU43P]